jgi:nickel/cobalt transporter (NicO) family protein
VLEGLLVLASSFWLGALHAATPGHGKTISAAYLVGMRGRPADAAALGIFVTLAHTSGIVLFGVIATVGSAALSQRSESYLGLATAVLILVLGLQMLWTQRQALLAAPPHSPAGAGHNHDHEHAGQEPGQPHSHGWGVHVHDELPVAALARPAATRPSWAMLAWLSIAGGLMPDPGAMAVLLGAIAAGKLVLGLLTVVVFSLGFASVLVGAGLAIGRFSQLALRYVASGWVERAQALTAVVIVAVGALMTAGSIRQLLEWR